jgi:predicted ATP-grasp superfamily ATP-dependent carboligase
LTCDTASDELLDVLEKLRPRFEQKPVLVTCEDWNVKNVSRNRESLREHYAFVLPDPQVVELVFDKLSFCTFAREHGFRVPRTFVVRSRADAEKAAAEMTFPCIVKPPGRTLAWESHTRFKVYKAENAAELLDIYDRYHMWAEFLLAQEWVVGPDGNIFSCYVYFDKNSRPVTSFVARKLRQWPPETGMSCSAEEVRNDEVRQQTLALFTSLGHKGLGHLEIKRDERTGEYVMIEAHVGRPTGKSAIAEAGGVELLYSMYCDALGWPLPENIVQRYRGVKWVHLRRDIQSALHYLRRGELTPLDWLRSMRGKTVHAVFSWSDPAPFLWDVFRGIRLLFHPEERVE